MASVTVDRGSVDAIARRTGFRRGGVEKALRLVSLLDEVSRDRFLGPRVVLKGGTGLNLFHGPLRRLSIDADLNYIGGVDLETMKAERGEVLRALDEVGASLNYMTARRVDEHAGTVTLFRYPSFSGSAELVKVDLNFLERVPILGMVERKAPNADLMFEGVSVPCLPADELAGAKLATLCLRGAPRDLFDVANLGSLPVDARVVRRVALFHGFMEDLDLSALDGSAVDRVSAKALGDKVEALLPRAASLDHGAVVRDAKEWTRTLLPLGATEKRFADGLRRGAVEPGLLFGDTHVHPRLAEHPGILHQLASRRQRR